MDKGINNADNLLSIYNDLTRAFKSSFESFERYYKKHLTKKRPELLEKELVGKLFNIHTYLKGAYAESVKKETVLLWLSRVNEWKENISEISDKVEMDLKDHEAHWNIPHRFFREEEIENDIQKTGKTYEELEPGYLKIIQDKIDLLRSIKPYIEASKSAITTADNEMRRVFSSFISEKKAKQAASNNHIIPSDDKGWPGSGPKMKADKKRIKDENVDSKIASFELIDQTVKNNLTQLCDYWKDNNVIGNIKAPDFRKVFEGKPTNVTIEWLKFKKYLKAFIDLLTDKKDSFVHPCDQWQIVIEYFTDKGKPLAYHTMKASKYSENNLPEYVSKAIAILKMGKKV